MFRSSKTRYFITSDNGIKRHQATTFFQQLANNSPRAPAEPIFLRVQDLMDLLIYFHLKGMFCIRFSYELSEWSPRMKYEVIYFLDLSNSDVN